MTRGKLVLLGEENQIYITEEFNGDMYPKGHGEEIIQIFERGDLQSKKAFYNYVLGFCRRNFHDAEYGDEIIRSTFSEEKKFDIRENWTDYLYIINNSGKEYTLLSNEGEINLPSNKMAIVHFQTLKTIKEISRNESEGSSFLISREEFSSMLNRMKETKEFIRDLNERLRRFENGQLYEFCNSAGLLITNEDCVRRLLSLLTEDEYGDIEYFIYELQYGEEYQEGCVTRENGSFVDLSSAERLYDCLEENRKERGAKNNAVRVEK